MSLMYNMKNIESNMEAQETPTLAGYSCKDFPW